MSSPPFLSATAHHPADPFRILVESVVDYAIYMVDPAKLIASWNPGAERIYGYRADEIIGQPFSTVFAPDDLASGRPEELWRLGLEAGRYEFECIRVRKDKSQFLAVVAVSALKDHFGNHSGFSVVTRDITELKRTENALRRERDLSEAVLASLPGVYYMYDENRRFLRWNTRIEVVSGYSAEEIGRLHPLDLFDPADRQRVAERIEAVFEDGRCEVEADLVTKDGRRIPYFFNGVRTEIDGQRCLLGMGIDLSSQQVAREELRGTTNLLRSVIEGTPDALFVKDRSGKYLLFNSTAARFVGKSVEEVLGRDDTALFDSESARIAMEHDQRVIALNQTITEEEDLTAAGLPRTYLATKMPFRDPEGNVIGVLGISRDITDQKRAEDALRQQQRLLRIAGRVARIGGWSLDLATQQVTWSDEIREIHEMPPGFQPSLADAIEHYAPECRERVAQHVRACAETGAPFDFELELITAKGRRVWVRSIGEAVSDDEGRIVSLQGAFQDISDRKKAQDEQRQLSERLATTLENITDGFITLDREWRFTYVNAEAERLISRRREVLLGITIWDAFPETLGAAFEQEYRRAVAEHVTVEFDEYFPPLGKWFGVRAHPTEQGLAIYFRDVTKSRELTAELLNDRSRLVAAQAVAKVGSWETDVATLNVIWSYETYRIFAKDPAQFQPTHARFLDLVHPEDRDAVDRTFQESLQRHAPQMIEHRIVLPDGGIKFVEERWQVLVDDQEKPVRVTGTCQDISERKQAEEALRIRDRAIQAVSQGILVTDPNQPDNPVVFASEGFERMTGYRADEVIGKNCRFLQGAETDRETIQELRSAITAARSHTVEILNYRKDGKPFWNQLSLTPVLGPAGELTHFVGVQTDITERRRLEEQFRQAQKMEAVGRLAGGVAHDFNNLLTIISGYSELLLDLPQLDDEVRDSVQEIRDAGERAAALTRQLLGFSRQSLLQPKVLDLNAVVVESGKMLRRLIGEDILFTMTLDPNLDHVKVDPGQLDQVLMNLAVNARDAMPKGGKLTVETSNVLLSQDVVASQPDCKPGPHVMLAMSDTGCGMTAEVMSRVFEPFFTTKEVGHGTGLGLSMVLGIVQQSGGCIHVDSKPGRGTTFKMYFPAVFDQLTDSRTTDSQLELRGTETVLIVEDEDGVRGLAWKSLEMQGYQVLTATDGKDALQVMKSHRGPLDLILTDVVMPNLNGPELVEKLKAGLPDVKVLYMSGYTDDAVVRHGLIDANVAFIQKPYTPQELSRKVRQVLDEKANSRG